MSIKNNQWHHIKLELHPNTGIFSVWLDGTMLQDNVSFVKEGSSFDVYHKDELIGHFDLPLYGKHMILNALSVIIFSYLEGLNMEEVHDSIKTFKGAKRRFKENFIKNVRSSGPDSS